MQTRSEWVEEGTIASVLRIVGWVGAWIDTHHGKKVIKNNSFPREAPIVMIICSHHIVGLQVHKGKRKALLHTLTLR